MNEAASTRANQLALALRHYLAGEEETGRLRAYEVARDAMINGAGLLAWSDETNLAIVSRNHFIINTTNHVCFAPLFDVNRNAKSVLGNNSAWSTARRNLP